MRVCAKCNTSKELTDFYKVGRDSDKRVDHDHATHKIRGLSCYEHNLAIGLLGDSADRMLSAAAYLDNPPAVCYTPIE